MKPRAWRNLIIQPNDELMDNYPSSSGSGSSDTLLATVAPSTANTEPVKPVTYIDPVLEDTLADFTTRWDGTPLIDPNSYTVVVPETFVPPVTTKPTETTVKETATNVVDDITNSIKDIFGGSSQSGEDNTGLYLAGAVVVIGLLALLFKK